MEVDSFEEKKHFDSRIKPFELFYSTMLCCENILYWSDFTFSLTASSFQKRNVRISFNKMYFYYQRSHTGLVICRKSLKKRQYTSDMNCSNQQSHIHSSLTLFNP